MSRDIAPVVGQWYSEIRRAIVFQVVAKDEEQGFVELQFFDGDLEELDMESWYEMDIEEAVAPEDWTGALEALEPDDTGDRDTATDEGG